MSQMNKYLLLITVLLTTCSCQLKHEPTTKEILEAEIPLVCQYVKNIYVWEGKDYREYEVRRVPISKEVSKCLNIPDPNTTLVSYLFDSKGNKTSYFFGLSKMAIGVDSVGFRNAQKVEPEYAVISIDIDVLHKDISGIYILALYQEKIDNKGNYKIAQIGDVLERIDRTWKVHIFDADEAFAEKEVVEKEFIMGFEGDLSSIFLHLKKTEKPERGRGFKYMDSIMKVKDEK